MGGARSRQKRRPQADNRPPRSPKRSEGGDRREAGGRRAGNWGPARSGVRGNGAPREDAGAKRRRWWPKAANRSRLQSNFPRALNFACWGTPKRKGAARSGLGVSTRKLSATGAAYRHPTRYLLAGASDPERREGGGTVPRRGLFS